MADTVTHVIVLVLENRSFDHMLGYLEPAYAPGTFEGISNARPNPDGAGHGVAASKTASGVLAKGPDHTHRGVMVQLKGPRPIGAALTNRGFVDSYAELTGTNGHAIMKCFDPARVPVLSGLARSFAVCDHWFCSVPGETWPNRNYVHAATSDGEVDIVMRPYWRRAIFDTLEDAGHDWVVYHRGPAQVWALPTVWQLPFKRHKRFRKLEELPGDIRQGRLPAYTFVEPDHGLLWPKDRSNSQHPSSNEHNGRDFYAGERLVLDIYRALVETPDVWKDTLFVITYDEHGGYYDHVAPPSGAPPAIAPDDKLADGFAFDLLGPRVPAVLVSPWIPEATVDQAIYDHSAIPASLKERFAPAFGHLTRRDAASATFWKNLSLPLPRDRASVVDPDALESQLNAAAATLTGLAAGASVEFGEPEPALDSFQRDLVSLAMRVDAALLSVPGDGPVPPEVVESAFRTETPVAGPLSAAAGLADQGPAGLVAAQARAAYLKDMERRFRGEDAEPPSPPPAFVTPPLAGLATTEISQQPRTFDILQGTPRWRALTAAETATAPYAAIASVRLHIVAAGGTVVFFMGTAWFLRPDTAVTAAHVTDISSAWAQVPAPQRWHLEIVPALSGAARPFGTFWTTAVRRHPLWSGRHTSPFDIATLAVRPAAGGAPFPAVQCLAPRADGITAASMPAVQISGYPHVVGAGATQVTASGPVRVVESRVCFYDIDTEDGQSGAPVMLAGASPAAVVAIHSGGRGNGSTAASSGLNAGLILGGELVDWLQRP